MKKITLLLFLFISISGFSQKYTVGIGINYDIGLKFKETDKYRISSSEVIDNSSCNIMTLDFFAKVKLKYNIFIQPMINFSLMSGSFMIDNLEGKYVPEGFTKQVPYSTVGNGWSSTTYSNDYLNRDADGSLSTIKIGSFVTKGFGDYFEIGTGFFFDFRKLTVDSYNAFDKYHWYGSTGTTWDNYSWEKIINSIEPVLSETITQMNISIPIIATFKYSIDYMYFGIDGIYYFSNNSYYSFRMALGYNF